MLWKYFVSTEEDFNNIAHGRTYTQTHKHTNTQTHRHTNDFLAFVKANHIIHVQGHVKKRTKVNIRNNQMVCGFLGFQQQKL